MDFEIERSVRKNSAIVFWVNLGLFFYSIYKAFILGLGSEYKFYTYIPFFLSIVASISIIIYTKNLFRTDISFSNSLSVFIGLIPFTSGCYITFFLGIYGIYTIIIDFNTLTLIRSIIFTFTGYKSVYHLWIISEIQKNYSNSNAVEKSNSY